MRSPLTNAPIAHHALALLGAGYAIQQSIRLFRFTWRHWGRPGTNLAKRYGGEGDELWAIVTGATSGIGKGCVVELAKQGFNLVLIARNQEKLHKLAEQLQTNYRIQTQIVSMDASKATANDIRQQVIQPLQEKSVALLVNVVGVHTLRPTSVREMTPEETEKIIRVNTLFPVLLTSLAIPLLTKKKTDSSKKSGGIINVGSLTSTCTTPLYATYAGTKAFNQQWSRCLVAEESDLDVICVRPGISATPMTGITESSFAVADPNRVAKKALGMVGVPQKNVVPYGPHELFDWLGRLLPGSLQDGIVLRMHQEKQKEIDQ